jgi:hypothetical protein
VAFKPTEMSASGGSTEVVVLVVGGAGVVVVVVVVASGSTMTSLVVEAFNPASLVTVKVAGKTPTSL